MAENKAHRHKVEHPAESYARPADLVNDEELSLEEKLKALDIWEQDARQLVTASNEGMEGEAARARPGREPQARSGAQREATGRRAAEAQAGALISLRGDSPSWPGRPQAESRPSTS